MLAQKVVGEWVIFRQVPGIAALVKDSRGMRTDCTESNIKSTGYFLRTHALRVSLQDVKWTFMSQRLLNALASLAFLNIHVMLHCLRGIGYMFDTGEIGSQWDKWHLDQLNTCVGWNMHKFALFDLFFDRIGRVYMPDMIERVKLQLSGGDGEQRHQAASAR